MRHTTPQELRGDIAEGSLHTHHLRRGPLTREDASYDDGRGRVPRDEYDLSDSTILHHANLTFNVTCDPADHVDYSWATPPARLLWRWEATPVPYDADFDELWILSDLELYQHQIHVVSPTRVLVSVTYKYHNEIASLR